MNKQAWSYTVVILLLVLLVQMLRWLASYNDVEVSSRVLYAFAANMVLCGYQLRTSKQAYSFRQVYWCFSLLFMGIVPALQYALDCMPADKPVSVNTILAGNLILLTSHLLFAFIYGYYARRHFNFRQAKKEEVVLSSKRFQSITIPVFIAAAVIYVFIVGFPGLFLRHLAEAAIDKLHLTFALLLVHILRGIFLYTMLLAVYFLKKRQLSAAVFIPLLIAGVLLSFPTAVPRFYVAAFYGGMLLTSNWMFTQRRHFISYVLLGGVALLFPLLSLFRFNKEMMNGKLSNVPGVYKEALSIGEFDAFAMLCRTWIYIQEWGITWGKQLLGVVFFFIPRSIWSSKPIGSGAAVTLAEEGVSHNVSSPLWAEGLINFGIPGVLLFVAAAALLGVLYDSYYWKKQMVKTSMAKLFYPLALFLFFFMLRGDLMSSFAYLSAYVCCAFVLHKLLLQKQ